MTHLIQHDLVKRAELFNAILDLVYSFDDNKQFAVEGVDAALLPTPKSYPPTILIINHRVICNGTSVDLSRRPAILQIVRLFIQAGTKPLSRDEILVGLYGHLDDDKITRRYRESLIANVIKSVSRARNFLTVHFSEAGIPLDWLVYDAMDRVWHLYRLR